MSFQRSTMRIAVAISIVVLLASSNVGGAAGAKTPGPVNADTLDGLDSTVFVRKDQTQHYSCLARDMAPRDQATQYADLRDIGNVPVFEGRYLTTSFTGTFGCAVHLPDGATVTGFSGDIRDVMDDGQAYCGLYKTPADGGNFILARTPWSGFLETPGDINLVAPSISHPLIDNAQFAYSAFCHLNATDTAVEQLLLTKVTVTYIGAP